MQELAYLSATLLSVMGVGWYLKGHLPLAANKCTKSNWQHIYVCVCVCERERERERESVINSFGLHKKAYVS